MQKSKTDNLCEVSVFEVRPSAPRRQQLLLLSPPKSDAYKLSNQVLKKMSALHHSSYVNTRKLHEKDPVNVLLSKCGLLN